MEGASIVLVGTFNPRIFHPAWFASNNLLRREEADVATSPDNARGCVISPELTIFSAGWLDLQVTQDRFTAIVADPANFIALRDLVLGVFQLLEHSPIDKMGINRQFHYQMPSLDEWHAFGDFLVPKTPWEGLIERPGMTTLSVNGPKPGSPEVIYNVRVEPSMRVTPGVFIETNEHHQPTNPDASRSELMKVLEEAWQSAQTYARNVTDHLFDAFYNNAG